MGTPVSDDQIRLSGFDLLPSWTRMRYDVRFDRRCRCFAVAMGSRDRCELTGPQEPALTDLHPIQQTNIK
jgi:hypothetical protein